MTLGIFLGIGESLEQMEKSGQKERFINQYLKEYAKRFDKVYLFSYANETDNLPRNVILIPNKSGFHRFLFSLFLPLVNRKQISDCDVVRGFGLTSAISSFLLAKPFIFNWPYDYGEFLRIEKRYILIPVFKFLEWVAFLKSNKILIATKLKLKSLKGSKFIYLPNGVDINLFAPARGLGSGMVYIGRLEKQKNLFFLLDAVASLPQGERVITFIGKGTQENDLKKYAHGKSISLKILPPVANSQLPKILSRFSIFTLPSFSEGSPKVLLEAMAAGLAPVVTNFTTVTDIIQDGINGFVTSYDIEKYSAKLELLLKDVELAKKIGVSARQTITKNFNIGDLITKEIKIIKEATS